MLVRTWYQDDAPGSVRQTLDDAGATLTGVNYDPWSVPEGTAPETFGFTGEWQDPGILSVPYFWSIVLKQNRP